MQYNLRRMGGGNLAAGQASTQHHKGERMGDEQACLNCPMYLLVFHYNSKLPACMVFYHFA